MPIGQNCTLEVHYCFGHEDSVISTNATSASSYIVALLQLHALPEAENLDLAIYASF